MRISLHPIVLGALSLSLSTLPAAAQSGGGSWQALPWVTADALRKPGITRGGEGGQWPRSIAIDGTDGSFLIHGTDVGGLFRSTDGGENWEPANVNYTPRGTCAVAIDPRNSDRCLSVGANSLASDAHGVWLSTNRAASWEQKLVAPIAASQDFRSQLSYDANSYDEELGHCTDAYWSRIRDDKANYGDVTPDPAIYRTSDGGETWERIPGSEAYAGGHIATHPTRSGVLYATHAGGVSISRDRGETFERLIEGEFSGICVSAARPEAVWVSHREGLKLSDDGGKTWTDSPISGMKLDGRENVRLEQPTASPVDADRMAIRSRDDNWGWKLHVSHDGGMSFENATFDNDDAFLPFNVRHWIVLWNPLDADVAHTLGGDWSTRSTDGGRSFAWHADGINGIMIGGAFHFNPAAPDTLYLTAQDYNGAYTDDAGESWRYVNASGKRWGGSIYAGYAVDAQTLLAADSDGWHGGRKLKLSRDGGETFEEHPEVTWEGGTDDPDTFGFDSSFADPDRAGVWFSGPFRSDDAGKTWSRMAGCHGVMAAQDGLLYGIRQVGESRSAAVTSPDGGATWEVLVEVDSGLRDLAPEVGGDGVYLADRGKLMRFAPGMSGPERLDVPDDALGDARVTSVATDPSTPGRVYATQTKNTHKASAGAMRSDDGGQTWAVLTRSEPLDGSDGARDGANEATWVRVHPTSGEAWFATGCYGLWKYVP